VNVDPLLGVATSDTTEPFGSVALQPSVDPVVQLTPPPVTVPAPVPTTVTLSGYVAGWKVADTDRAALMYTEQEFGSGMLVQPVQRLTTEPASGAAVSVTVVYDHVSGGFATSAVQPSVAPVAQLRPAPVMVPVPPLAMAVAVSGNVLGSNFAVTDFAPPVMYTVQVLGAPETGVHPDQLLNTEFGPAVAVSVTVAYAVVFAGFGTAIVQPSVDPVVQLRPPPLMVPTPVPDVAAVSGHVLGSNRADTAFAALTLTVQTFGVSAAGIQPDQLLNTELASGVAVSVTVVYALVFAGFGTVLAHPSVEPVVQLRPAPVIVPTPVPVEDAVRVNALGSNLAVTLFGPLTNNEQVLGSASGMHPTHVLKTDAASAEAESVRVVYEAVLFGLTIAAVQPLAPPVVHAIPPPETVPMPVPDVATVTANVLGSNLAETLLGPLM
jgi:hypothetical protein